MGKEIESQFRHVPLPPGVPSWGTPQPGGRVGVALEWEPWNWDLWHVPLEPDDDSESLELWMRKLEEALEEFSKGQG